MVSLNASKSVSGALLILSLALVLSSCTWIYTLFFDPPSAVLVADPTEGSAPLDVEFDLSDSTAPGGVQQFRLDFGDGSDFATGNSVELPIAHTYAHPGTYTAVLELTSEYRQTDHDTATIVIEGYAAESGPGDAGPIAVLAADTTLGDAPLAVFFDISLSSAPGSTLVSFRLDFGDGTTPYTGSNFSQTIAHLYVPVGLHTATLYVTDANGDTGTATLDIVATTEGGGDVPIAKFDWTPNEPFIDEDVTFDAGQSIDPASGPVDPKAIVVYTWDFGDGTGDATTGETIDHTYTWPGTYTVTLTIYDDDGLAGTATEEITVRGAIAYVSSYFDGSITQIRLPWEETLPIGIDTYGVATGVAIAPDGSAVYTGEIDFFWEEVYVGEILTPNHTLGSAAFLEVPVFDLACSPNGDWLYTLAGFPFEWFIPMRRGVDTQATLPNANGVGFGELLVISTATMGVVQTAPTQGYPASIAFSPAGGAAYVVGSDPNSLIWIDTSTHSFAGEILFGATPYGIAVTSTGEYALVTFPDVAEVLLIDLVGGEVVDVLSLEPEAGPMAIALTHDDALAYVTDPWDCYIHVIDIDIVSEELSFLESIDFYGPMSPGDIAISPGDSVAVVTHGLLYFEGEGLNGIEDWEEYLLFLLLFDTGGVSILDLETHEFEVWLPAGFSPFYIDIWGIGY